MLWWVMLAGAVLILFGVMAAALYALKSHRYGRGLSERLMLIGGGLGFPLVTLTTLLIVALLLGEEILAEHSSPWRVDATSEQWAWTFTYPDAPGGPVRSVGELHVPAGRTIEVHVTSTDVIHSFWVPRLAGKIDAIPGQTNVIRLRADAPGVYHGLCAEFCGVGHAHMQFAVHAHPEAEFAATMQHLAAESVE